ncbi:MoaD/ThiS family protein [Salinicoccus sp. HZC-1]|uniref:MoaD/ThiS family protein n=1 Tax=Salinicoccus sp. HZC-1 TaxID=3385497 RepID=UPI00398BA819
MNVLLFAGLKEKIGDSRIALPVEDAITAGDLRNLMYTKFPQIEGDVFQIACNESFVKDGHIIELKDEVALIPPVSGG